MARWSSEASQHNLNIIIPRIRRAYCRDVEAPICLSKSVGRGKSGKRNIQLQGTGCLVHILCVSPTGLEPVTPSLGPKCSIQTELRGDDTALIVVVNRILVNMTFCSDASGCISSEKC